MLILFILLALIVSIALWLIMKPIFGEKLWLVISITLISIVLSISSLYLGCSDGWYSHSIGIQGACSHHGGVDTKINSLGMGILLFSFIIFIGYYIIARHKEKYKFDIDDFREIDERTLKHKNSQINLIKEAIDQEKLIGFRYEEYNGTKGDKTLKPLMMLIQKQTGVLCVIGLCKKKNKYFAVHKMSDIKIL